MTERDKAHCSQCDYNLVAGDHSFCEIANKDVDEGVLKTCRGARWWYSGIKTKRRIHEHTYGTGFYADILERK